PAGAKETLDHALQLAADAPETQRTRGFTNIGFNRLCRRDWHLHGLELALTQQRRTRSPRWALSARRQGDFAEAIRRLDQAVNSIHVTCNC
ncbi:MAG: hypothetical protein DLM52_12295, partial [Chthoniobacterales bacterium]